MTVPTPVVDPAALAEQAIHFERFGSITARHLPLYQRLCLAAADDLDVVARLFLARPEQRRVNLLLAAVHDVLLAGADDPLAAWYSSVTDPPRRVGRGGDDPWPHFRRLALEDDDVAERLATRATQTNEVGRCATTLLALADLAPELGLVEVGASAGLNLLLDRYDHDYALPDGRHHHVGPGSPLVLPCQVRGDRRPPFPSVVPKLTSRIGVDLDPVDLFDRAATRWLVACQWPDQLERLHRVRTALAVAHGDPPRVVQGDAVDEVAALVGTVPARVLPVVLATWVMAYLPEDRQRSFLAELDRVGADRDLSFVFAEQPLEVPGLPVPEHPDGQADPRFTALVRVDWRGGRRTAERLADQHPHGTWVRWLT